MQILSMIIGETTEILEIFTVCFMGDIIVPNISTPGLKLPSRSLGILFQLLRPSLMDQEGEI